MSKNETKAWGPILDALPFGETQFKKRRDRIMALTKPMKKRLGLTLAWGVPSGSMSPVLVGGEFLLGDLRPKDIRVGDIVAYFWEDGDATCHRVIRIEEVDGEKRYITKGDSNLKQDKGYRTREQIEARLIRVFRPPLLGRYISSDYFWRKGKPWVGKPSIQAP